MSNLPDPRYMRILDGGILLYCSTADRWYAPMAPQYSADGTVYYSRCQLCNVARGTGEQYRDEPPQVHGYPLRTMDVE